MKFKHTVIAPGLALAAMAWLALPAPALGQTAGRDAAAEGGASGQEHINARVRARLTRMAERLQINAGQQAAWAAYTQTVERLFTGGRSQPPAAGDAATLLRFRAERAAEHAQKLTQLAEATETLQQVLTPEQRQTLDQMMRHKGRGMHGRRGGHGRAS